MKSRLGLVKGAFFLLLIIILYGCSVHVPEELPEEMSTASISHEEEISFDQIKRFKQNRENKGSGGKEEKVYWTITVDEYEVSLKDLVPGTSLKLVLSKGESEVIAHTFRRNKEYELPEEIQAGPFENLLGHNGFWIHVSGYAYMDWTYFNAIEDGRMVCLAYSWGTEYRPGENYMVDLDKDGDLELICNVTYGGDGAERTYIYHYAEGQIWEGSGSMLLDEDYYDWGTNSTETEYLPDEEVIRIWFQKKEMGDYVSKDYKIDLEQLEMQPYEIGQVF